MMCSCPWCSRVAVKGYESLMGQPTCEEHGWRAAPRVGKKGMGKNFHLRELSHLVEKSSGRNGAYDWRLLSR